MLKYKNITELTDDEIREIVTDLFSPIKITAIRRNKKQSYISCSIYTEWECDEGTTVIRDSLILSDPFEYSTSIMVDGISVHKEDYDKFKRFCLAKGVCIYLKDNEYIRKRRVKKI